jgi:hypothetical protein
VPAKAPPAATPLIDGLLPAGPVGPTGPAGPRSPWGPGLPRSSAVAAFDSAVAWRDPGAMSAFPMLRSLTSAPVSDPFLTSLPVTSRFAALAARSPLRSPAPGGPPECERGDYESGTGAAMAQGLGHETLTFDRERGRQPAPGAGV